MRNRMMLLAAASAVALLPGSKTLAVVQTYSSATGMGSLTAVHPGGGFFQNDGEFDTGLTGDFGFSGSDGGFIQEISAILGGGLTGAADDHGAYASVDYTGGGNFWFGGLGNDGGPLPSLNLAQVLAWADVLAPAGKPFEYRVESDFGPTGNGFVFSGVGAGTWQTVGGTLATAQPIGNFNPNDPELALVVAFAQELTAWDTGPEPAAVIRVDNLTLTIDQASWASSSGGEWTDNANWSPIAPNGASSTAVLGSNIAGASTVTLASEVFVGTIQFDSSNSYTLSGPGELIIRRIGFPGTILASQGNHTIDVPVRLMSNTDVSVPVGGTLNVKQFTGAVMNIQQGTVRMIPDGTAAATSNVKALTLAGGSTPTATIDITDNAFVVDYDGASPLATLRDQIVSAYAGGAWTGNGITSSVADASNFGIGYVEASSLGTVPAIFGDVDSTAVLFRSTRYGDANLDGLVNLADFNALAGNFGSTFAGWGQGDFNYDGNVNLADFNRLAANFGLQASGPEVTPGDWAALAAVVPEPASATGLVVLAGALLRRRQRTSVHGG